MRNTFSSYLQQVCVNKLRAPHARGLVELWLKQNGNVLGGGGLLVGQAGLGLAQLWRLDTGVTVQGWSRQHHGGLGEAALHKRLRPEGGRIRTGLKMNPLAP